MAFEYGGATILSSPLFVTTILPFLLIFTIVFAVLQKAKIFGSNKKQIDAIVALVIGLLAISFRYAVGIIVELVPFLAVSLVIIVILMILLGSFHPEGELKLPSGLRWALIGLSIIALVVAILLITGFWNTAYDYIVVEGGSGLLTNIIFIIIAAAAISAVIWGGEKSKSKKED
jgi:hypothetical protein